MTPLLSCKGLSQSYSGKALFDNLEISINEGERIGLIGANGNGKSTLMKVFAGLVETDDGHITKRKGMKEYYLTQSPEFDKSLTAEQVVLSELEKHNHQSDHSVTSAIALSKAGFSTFTETVKNLSGGWQKRLQIAAALACDPDLLLLDEPTNHLDIRGVLWLEQLLSQLQSTWIVVSHDRHFLQKTVTSIVEIDKMYKGGVFKCQGSYDEFLQRKDDYISSQVAYSASLASKVRREDAWLARGPKARTTKAKGRIDQAHELKEELATVRGRLQNSKSDISFSSSGRKTKKLIEFEDVAKSLGGKSLIEGLSLVLQPKKCLGILGDNGTGKTTLLKLFAKSLDPDTGSVSHANDLRIVYFDQYREGLDEEWTLSRALCEDGDSVVYRDRSIHVTTWAQRFRFDPKNLNVKVKTLSGGEKARVIISRLMLQPADVLLLDEPTNDLDIVTREILEESLTEFTGATVLITHDRYMMSKLCHSFYGFDGQGGGKLIASYDQWEESLRTPAKSSTSKQSKKDSGKTSGSSSSKKLSYMEQREYDSLEEKILEAETKLEECEAAANDPAIATQAMKLKEVYSELEAAKTNVESLYARWAELENKINPS